MTVVLKLGGSVVTDKDTPETVDEEALGDLAEDIAGHDDLVLVHGGGSFGHHHASEYGVSRTSGTHDAAGVRAIHDAMKALNDAVLDALHARGVPAVAVHPFSVGYRDEDGKLTFPVVQVGAMLAEGFVPVLHGDVITHEGKGATIVSGDELVVALAAGLDAERVGLCSAVPGVLDDEGRVIDRIEAFGEVEAYLGGSDATDVTGGMAAKVRELLALGAPAHIFDRGGVGPFLAGEEPGTRIG
jgi:isopentenyl phosphate kinase